MVDEMKLYNQDCLPAMKEMPDNAFSLAIVDPQYGIGVSRHSEIGYRGANVFKKKTWDDAPPTTSYFNELRRVSVNQLIFGGNYFTLPPTRGFFIWDKGEGFKGRSYAECEMGWTSFDRNALIYKRDPLARGDYHGKIHPTQKPVALYKWLLTNYAKPGQTILDTHGGSLSIAIACDDLGFDLTAFEIDLEYIEGATDRLIRHRTQGVLPL